MLGGQRRTRPGEAAWGPRAAADPPSLFLHLRCFLFRRQQAKRGFSNDRQKIKIVWTAPDLQEKEPKLRVRPPPPAEPRACPLREPRSPGAQLRGSHGSHGSLAASTSALRAQEKSSPDGRPSTPLTDGQVTGVYLIGTIKHSINTKKKLFVFPSYYLICKLQIKKMCPLTFIFQSSYGEKNDPCVQIT